MGKQYHNITTISPRNHIAVGVDSLLELVVTRTTAFLQYIFIPQFTVVSHHSFGNGTHLLMALVLTRAHIEIVLRNN